MAIVEHVLNVQRGTQQSEIDLVSLLEHDLDQFLQLRLGDALRNAVHRSAEVLLQGSLRLRLLAGKASEQANDEELKHKRH